MTLPNKITFIRILFVPIFMFFAMPAAAWYPDGLQQFLGSAGSYIAIALFIIAALTDILDGSLARSRNEVTNLGKFLDPIADKLLVLSGLLVLIVRFDLSAWVLLIVFTRELMVMGIRMIAAGEGVVVAASIWGKVKTIMQIIAIVAYMLNDIVPKLFGGVIKDMWYLDDILMGVAILITIYSGFDYLMKNISFLKKI
ncbi:MAG: CDP-diacylglycerol--glycerol-3-phosphate 3-phosphatidyltransferase [Clostridiales bacterium]|nr:CDP-diacylglycerol--glycerol-3-phosphate 3-phosphatidyltransferase [Clostridiales bacterium]